MSRLTHVILTFLFLGGDLFAQSVLRPPSEPELILRPGPEGANAAAVAFNPLDSVWYSVFAGNPRYDLDSYSYTGDSLGRNRAGFDYRSLWWNEKETELQGNGYDDQGWRQVHLGENGVALSEGYPMCNGSSHQPGSQSVGAYEPRSKKIAFFHDGRIFLYHPRKNNLRQIISLRDCPISPEAFNSTSLICTGDKNLRYGLLHPANRRVYFFDRKGRFKESLPLAKGIPAPEFFGFSYAGGLMFLYDSRRREWLGYRIFEPSGKK